ncbi:hypothetical protein TNCV_4713491 [Trichonephila clavipes]|nr:hypothetical protein TNCV_4713491 [Trichonephila clavipes]
MFRFPKEDFLRKKWIQAISRKDFAPSKYSKVCELHFLDNAIRRYTEGGNILGMAYNSEQAATLAYVFMIQSLLSPLKEVVHIMPVKKIDGEKLLAVVKKTIVELDVVATSSKRDSIPDRRHLRNPFDCRPRLRSKMAFSPSISSITATPQPLFSGKGIPKILEPQNLCYVMVLQSFAKSSWTQNLTLQRGPNTVRYTTAQDVLRRRIARYNSSFIEFQTCSTARVSKLLAELCHINL